MLKSIHEMYSNLSRLPKSVFYAGIIASIICAVAGTSFMMYMLITNQTDPYLWYINMQFLVKTSGLFMLSIIVPLFISFVKTER